MGAITVRNLDEDIKKALRKRAAERGVSMEQEVRDVLRASVKRDFASGERQLTFSQSVESLKEKYGAFELDIPERSRTMREPPRFE
ncbi:plasmid stabilization protein [Corticibacterium sp. UT-5YL-CI-8]|nr:plasmid stabilization protein [Tianweitania sp. UT-5YL-CI-8]